MEEKIINGTTIWVSKNGVKFRKSPNGKRKRVCANFDCIKNARMGQYGNYCYEHYNDLTEFVKKKLSSNSEIKKVNDKRTKIIISKMIIDNIEIYIDNNNKKFRKDKRGNYVLVCKYDNCIKFSHTKDRYCLNHVGGTTTDSPERIKQKEIKKKKYKRKVIIKSKWEMIWKNGYFILCIYLEISIQLKE